MRINMLAGIIATIAGAYLLLTQSAAANSIFNPLLHGIGAYILARGIWMMRHAGQADDVTARLDKLIEFAGYRHTRDDPPPVGRLSSDPYR